MLKKFLKFLRGDGEDSEEVEQSYLNDLLRRVQPRIVEELDECPEHDPVPLLVAEIVREVDRQRFDQQLDRPVTDPQSPRLDSEREEDESSAEETRPPPPPGAESGEKTQNMWEVEGEIAEEEDEEASEADDGGESGEGLEAEGDDSDEPAADAENEESAEPSGENDANEESGESSEGNDENGESTESSEERDENEEATGSSEENDPPESSDESEDELEGEADDGEPSEDEESKSAEAEEEGDGDRAVDEAPSEAEGDEEEADGKDVENDEDDSQASADETKEVDDSEENSKENDVPPPIEPPVDENDDGAPSEDTDEFFETDEEDTDVQYDGPTTVETADRVSQRAGRVVEESASDEPPPVDSVTVLEMGRVFLGMLVENDSLPVELQLSPDEIDEARKLLYGYFLGEELVDNRAREMLRMVENKFDEGLFSQARILLQLFDADKQTRIENDRNLFYEEMILRFGIQRRHPVGDDIVDRFDERIDQFEGTDDELEDLLVWLSQSIYVTFDLHGRNQREVEEWREIAELSERPRAADRLLDVIPPERWRLLDEFQRPATSLLEERLTEAFVEEYVTGHVKTCYFILRAVGDTGLEPYLDVFFDWVDGVFDVDGTGLMPWLYTETTANERLIDDIFHELYVEHFQSEAESMREEWEPEAIEEAIDSVVERVGATELSEIPPGHYDFGRFVLDELFEVEYPSEDFPFKMHRIT